MAIHRSSKVLRWRFPINDKIDEKRQIDNCNNAIHSDNSTDNSVLSDNDNDDWSSSSFSNKTNMNDDWVGIGLDQSAIIISPTSSSSLDNEDYYSNEDDIFMETSSSRLDYKNEN